MVRYQVIYTYVNIRTGPSTEYRKVGTYDEGEIINSGGYPFEGEDGNIWVSYTGGQSGKTRYVCFRDHSTQYLERID